MKPESTTDKINQGRFVVTKPQQNSEERRLLNLVPTNHTYGLYVRQQIREAFRLGDESMIAQVREFIKENIQPEIPFPETV